MKIVGRDFVGGYFLTSLATEEDPELYKVLRGVRYKHAYSCGVVNSKSFTFIKFTPGELSDTQGDNQEMFDMSGIGADQAYADLIPILVSESP